jgi:hypothetical protein
MLLAKLSSIVSQIVLVEDESWVPIISSSSLSFDILRAISSFNSFSISSSRATALLFSSVKALLNVDSTSFSRAIALLVSIVKASLISFSLSVDLLIS